MMAWNTLEVTRDDGVELVRFDRGGNLNAINQELMLELTDVARSFHHDLDTRAVVLTGTQQAFSAGIDLKDPARWALDDLSLAERRAVGLRGQELCRAWEEMPQITIPAAIEGTAVGGGGGLAIACDWRVAARGSFLYVPEIKVGLNLGWQTLPRLINLVGPARAKRIVILCEKLAPAQALDWGLLDEVSADGEAVACATAMARKAASMPPVVVRMTKQAINATANALTHVASYMDADQAASVRDSPEALRARREFAAKAKDGTDK